LRLIFSRKGFDGGTGGCPSPIIDGNCISLPIPTRMPTPVTFADLNGRYGDLVEDLTKGRIGSATSCHLDPDISEHLLARKPGWRGAIGQVGSAQSHLRKQSIGPGDLFLFWGLFREVTNNRPWTFVGRPEHRIFGWLQVGNVIHLGADGSQAVEHLPWLADHPHVRSGWSDQNTLYVAANELKLDGRTTKLPGYGQLQRGFRLTAREQLGRDLVSIWKAPRWLSPRHGGVGMTYHASPERWDDETVRVVSRGQEFVANIDSNAAALDWVERILGHQTS
jgi:hypothetical protein